MPPRPERIDDQSPLAAVAPGAAPVVPGADEPPLGSNATGAVPRLLLGAGAVVIGESVMLDGAPENGA